MLNRKDNDLLTRTGPGTPGGKLMRSYWQPAALSYELEADVPLPLTLLGEELVMFRDGDGKPQVVQRQCPHRRSDLSYGRVESDGIRCIYHGWVINGAGEVIERPAEGARSKACLKIATGYPCHEAGGLILVYMGEGEPPKLPGLHFLTAPEDQVFVMKVYQDCNYLQGNEGNIDPAHLSFLHLFLPQGVNENLNIRSGALNNVLDEDKSPEIRVEETDFGLRITSSRQKGEDKRFVRVTHFIMPNTCIVHGSPQTDPRKDPISANCGYQMNWHVPINDVSHWKYVISYRFDGPVDKEFMQTTFHEVGSDFVIDRNRQNRFRQDREEMRTRSFAGLGSSFFVHDKCVVETQGEIMEREEEHLGATDIGLVMMRRQMLKAIKAVEDGKDPLMVDREPDENSLADLSPLSVEIDADMDITGDWWRQFFVDGRPIADIMQTKPR